jgi:replicative DNA helicase
VSVVELPPPAPSEFERTPPQDLAAEQCVLGGMMLSKDAIADVVEVLKSVDFYKPAHALVFDAVLDLYGRGEPADAITVAAELTKRGEIGRAGGAPYLHTLISSVPTAANAGYYAQIVAERSILRRLVEAGTRITQMGYSGDGEVDSIVDAAQAEIYQVTERRASEDYQPLSAIMEGTLDEIESIGNRGGEMIGVPTGFVELDQLTNGFHPGQMIIIAARPAIGKALALDTPLPTPTGWTTMGEIEVGDELIGADGRPTRVVAATEVLHSRPCYAVSFSDGTTIVADAAHQWLTDQRVPAPGPARGRGYRAGVAVRTTAELAATVRGVADGRANHSVATTRPLDLPARSFPIPPYVVGVRLGVRHVAVDTAVIAELGGTPLVRSTPEAGGTATLAPARVDALRAGRVPKELLRASVAQRRALLSGLLDANGTVMPNGVVHFSTRRPGLAEDVSELVVGLGYVATTAERRVAGRRGPETEYTVTFRPSEEADLFRRGRSARKRAVDHRWWARDVLRPASRVITAVTPVPSVPVRCVQVDNDDHLYLAGRGMIPTHNSTLALDFVRSAAIKHNQTAVIFSLEMGRNEITMRLLSAEAQVGLHKIRSGTLTDEDWTRLARRMGEVSSSPLFIDDSPNLTMMEIRAKARRLKQRHDVRLIVIDYMQLMTSGKKVESRQQEVSEFSRSLKLLAKELEVPVIALSQLNRGPEQRTDKKPMLSDLRESGSLEQDADIVILLHREDFYEKESPRAGEADLIVAKHRNGPTSTVTVAFQGHYSRFTDMMAQ